MKLGDQPQWDEHQVIPSGSIALDHALGIGGYPKGRIIEIYGPESSGKTTLAIHAIAQAQKQGGIAAMIDAEHAFDRSYAKALGVNLDTLLISQPDNGEQALEIADNLIRSGAIDIIVIDSVAALTPKAEIEGEMGDNKVEVLRISTYRCPQDHSDQGWRRGPRKPHQGEGRKEQDGSTFQEGGIRYRLW